QLRKVKEVASRLYDPYKLAFAQFFMNELPRQFIGFTQQRVTRGIFVDDQLLDADQIGVFCRLLSAARFRNVLHRPTFAVLGSVSTAFPPRRFFQERATLIS